jgi:hypothetical protein
MSYKDRAAWWISAKWNGYQSTKAYRRGDAPNPNESSRYGEPGFFIATRVPYYDAQAAVSTITAVTEPVPESVVTPKPAEPESVPVHEPTTPKPTLVDEVSAEPVITAGKKKKKKHGSSSGPGAGKTIQISLK